MELQQQSQADATRAGSGLDVLRSDNGGVDVFFLRRVDTHERLDGLEEPLPFAQHVAVGRTVAQIDRELVQKARKMLDFPMGAAHGCKPMLIGENLGQFGIDAAFVPPLVLDDVRLNDGVAFEDQVPASVKGRHVEFVCDLAQAIEAVAKPGVVEHEFARDMTRD